MVPPLPPPQRVLRPGEEPTTLQKIAIVAQLVSGLAWLVVGLWIVIDWTCCR